MLQTYFPLFLLALEWDRSGNDPRAPTAGSAPIKFSAIGPKETDIDIDLYTLSQRRSSIDSPSRLIIAQLPC